jgi:hypothetical protein
MEQVRRASVQLSYTQRHGREEWRVDEIQVSWIGGGVEVSNSGT